jgi:hypothetical protein
MDDMFGANNYGSTIYMPGATDATPVFDLTATRGCTFETLNVIGGSPTSPAPGSAAFVSSNYEQGSVFRDVTIRGFDVGVRIGRSPTETSGNNDFWTFDSCLIEANTGILNYGNESYGIRANNCFFFGQWAYTTVAQSSSSTMVSFKANRCFFGVQSGIVYVKTNGVVPNGADMIVLDSCILEPTGINTGNAMIMDWDQFPPPFNTLGFTARNCTFNLGGDTLDVYTPAYRTLRYSGRGPFIFDGNIVGGTGRIVFELATNATGWDAAAARICNNVFTTARLFIRWPSGDPFPNLYQQGNLVQAESKLSMGDPPLPPFSMGTPDPLVRQSRPGISRNAPALLETWDFGSVWTNDLGIPLTRHTCRQAGTFGTISGVKATIVAGQDFATLTLGDNSEQRKIVPGSYIMIGDAFYLQVRDVVGTTIYLNQTATVTATDETLDFAAPVFFSEQFGAQGPPSSGNWLRGDVAWSITPLPGMPPGWVCVFSGSPGGWQAMASLAP